MWDISEAAGENPMLIPPASLAPKEERWGQPVVAPVINTHLCLAISLPISLESSATHDGQLSNFEAPLTAILYFTPLEVRRYISNDTF